MSGRTQRYVTIAWVVLVVLGSGATLVLEQDPPRTAAELEQVSPGAGPEPAVSGPPAEPPCPPPAPGPDHDPGDPIRWACITGG